MLLTTVMPGFPFHEFPSDYWRYERSDMNKIFSDFQVLTIETDSDIHGIYVKALKPEIWQPNNLDGIQLYSMERERKLATEYHVISFRVKEKYLCIVRPLCRFFFPRNKWCALNSVPPYRGRQLTDRELACAFILTVSDPRKRPSTAFVCSESSC
jgi:hypothetical protein